jgi:hypothetical protein
MLALTIDKFRTLCWYNIPHTTCFLLIQKSIKDVLHYQFFVEINISNGMYITLHTAPIHRSHGNLLSSQSFVTWCSHTHTKPELGFNLMEHLPIIINKICTHNWNFITFYGFNAHKNVPANEKPFLMH